MTSSKKNECKKSKNNKLKSQCISWKTINPHYKPNRKIQNECNKELKKKESCMQIIESPAEQNNQPNADKWSKCASTSQPVEREDGELSGEEAELAPICRFYWSNNCTWGSDCRFRHPGSTGLGNYKMFESISLPTCTNMNDRMDNLSPVINWRHETEMKRTMDSFGRIVLQAKPKVESELPQYEDNELMEYNDLDTDPYYTHQEPTESIDSDSQAPMASRGYPSVSMEWPERHMWAWPVRRSSSRCSCCSNSSSDYSSTTNSTSSSSQASLFSVNPLKRKLSDRRPSSSSSSDSDSSSSSYSSSTHTSEQSSSSSDMESIQNDPNSMRMRCEPPLKRRKTLQSVVRRI